MLRGFHIAFSDFSRVPAKERYRRSKVRANWIRPAIDYRSFESAPFRYDERSFTILSQILQWCARYHLFVILDMHLVPGGTEPDFRQDRLLNDEDMKSLILLWYRGNDIMHIDNILRGNNRPTPSK
jgi:hypothetical protein